MDPVAATTFPARSTASLPWRRHRGAALVLAALVLLGGACSQDTSEGGQTPADQEPLPPEQPGDGEGDPTLSGDEAPGVGGGNTGGDGSGAPDSGSGSGSAGDSPTAGDDG